MVKATSRKVKAYMPSASTSSAGGSVHTSRELSEKVYGMQAMQGAREEANQRYELLKSGIISYAYVST